MKNLTFLLFSVFIAMLYSCKDDDIPTLPEEPDQEQVTDDFVGEQHRILLKEGMERFHQNNFNCRLLTPDGKIINRKGTHLRMSDESILNLRDGLKDGEYRILDLTYKVFDDELKDSVLVEYGLGCRISIQNKKVHVLDAYRKSVRFFGEGTAEDPFIVSSPDHLFELLQFSSDYFANDLMTNETHFLQTADLDMKGVSKRCSKIFGWLGIGEVTQPFKGIYDGGGYKISRITANYTENKADTLPRTAIGIGLFNYTLGAVVKNVHIDNSTLQGNFGVGSIIGGVLAEGDKVSQTTLINCSVNNSYITGVHGSIGIGGLVGSTEIGATLYIDSCSTNNTIVSGEYNVGGIFGIGGLYSSISLMNSNTDESTKVSGGYSCIGGLVGSADSLSVIGCVNKASVVGGSFPAATEDDGRLGVGGIAGGTGASSFISCINAGHIEGYEGVGGLLGTTRVGIDEAGNTCMEEAYFYACKNQSTVKGVDLVGGICGESQFCCYSVLNTGEVMATGDGSILGGIVGNTSSCASNNAMNLGKLTTTATCEAVGGIVGRTIWASIISNENHATIKVNAAFVGGIVGAGGNYSVIHFCANYGHIMNMVEGAATGGIVGEIGDPKNWSEKNKRACIISCIKMARSIIKPCRNLCIGKLAATTAAASNAWKQLKKVENAIVNVPVILGKAINGTYKLVKTGISYSLWPDIEELEKSNTLKSSQIEASIKNEISNIRNSFTLAPGILPEGFNIENLKNFVTNNSRFVAFGEENDDNCALINSNINIKRQDRMESVETFQRVKKIIQTSVSGVTLVLGTALSVAGLVVTGGTSAASAVLLGGIATSFVGGINSLIANTTDFNSNAVIVSQCVNMGNLSSNKKSSTGGIIGKLQNFGRVRDCLNGGRNLSEFSSSADHGGIVGFGAMNSKLIRNLNLSDSHLFPLCGTINGPGVLQRSDDNYQYGDQLTQFDDDFVYLSLPKVGKIKSFDDFSIASDANSLWQLQEGEGQFPVPARSEMQDQIEE